MTSRYQVLASLVTSLHIAPSQYHLGLTLNEHVSMQAWATPLVLLLLPIWDHFLRPTHNYFAVPCLLLSLEV